MTRRSGSLLRFHGCSRRLDWDFDTDREPGFGGRRDCAEGQDARRMSSMNAMVYMQGVLPL